MKVAGPSQRLLNRSMNSLVSPHGMAFSSHGDSDFLGEMQCS